MAYYVHTSILKSYGPGLRVRDEYGNAKTLMMDTERVCIPSASLKYMMRREVDGEEIRTAYMGLLIRNYLNKRIASGALDEADYDICNHTICSILGCKPVNRLDNAPEEVAEETDEAETDTDTKKKKVKGNTVLVFATNTLYEILAKLLPFILENKDSKGLAVDAKAMAEEIYDKNPRTKNEALFGVMSTSGIMKTMYGSVHMNHMYSIDRYAGDSNFWIATHQSDPNSVKLPSMQVGDETDSAATTRANDFFSSLVDFNKQETTKPNADTMGEHDIYSNTMYGNMTIDIRTLFENLNAHNPDKSTCSAETTADLTYQAIKSYLTVNPGAKQNGFASYPVPEVAYFEVVKNGAPAAPEFKKQITPGRSSVVDQGIVKIANWAKDTTFRTGDIKKYVMLPNENEEYASLFEDAGVTVISSLAELEQIIKSDVTDIVTNELL